MDEALYGAEYPCRTSIHKLFKLIYSVKLDKLLDIRDIKAITFRIPLMFNKEVSISLIIAA